MHAFTARLRCMRALTLAQVKVVMGPREEEALVVRAPVSAGGIEWEQGGALDAFKLPDIIGGGAVAQNVGGDVFDFHEHKQPDNLDRRPRVPRPAHL
jgi:hypothetical protein